MESRREQVAPPQAPENGAFDPGEDSREKRGGARIVRGFGFAARGTLPETQRYLVKCLCCCSLEDGEAGKTLPITSADPARLVKCHSWKFSCNGTNRDSH